MWTAREDCCRDNSSACFGNILGTCFCFIQFKGEYKGFHANFLRVIPQAEMPSTQSTPSNYSLDEK